MVTLHLTASDLKYCYDKPADGNARRVQGAHDRLFVTTSGFANDLGVRMPTQVFEELGMALGIIGQGMETAREMQLQRELGNIEADVEDGRVVLTQTCGIRATERITSTRMRGAEVPTRTVRCPVATGQRTPACLSLSWQPSRTIRKIQGAAYSDDVAPTEL